MATAPSTAQTPYLVPSEAASVLPRSSAPATGFRLDMEAGRPVRRDGAFDNGDGTITVLLNHELSGNAASCGARLGRRVRDRLVIDINSLKVLSAGELVTSGGNIFTTDLATGTVYSAGTTAFNHICSADSCRRYGIFRFRQRLGTASRIYLTGEEAGSEGRGFAFVATGADAGKAFELPRLGNMSFENIVANPAPVRRPSS
jgi:hypothetical protein